MTKRTALQIVSRVVVAVALSIGALFIHAQFVLAQDLEEGKKACEATTCGNGEDCILCQAVGSNCNFHANCQFGSSGGGGPG